MEVESAVLFNVNPPSPQGSDYYSDEQDTILRAWHTGGGSLIEPLQFSHSMPHHLAEKGYCGIITPYEYAASFDPDSINTLVKDPVQPTDMSFVPSQDPGQDRWSSLPHRGSLGAVGGFRASESSSNALPGYPRKSQLSGRRGPGESSRKSELYKTELCISLSTGNPCRYGDQCQFAHSKEELQHVNRHPRYKTQFCMSFQAHGYCKYNERCTFIHHPEEARVSLESIPGYQGNTTDGTSNTTAGSTSPTEEPRADRTRALSDPGFASASSAAGESTEHDSGPHQETRHRSNVSYPPDLLYKLAHPQMAQFTDREYTASAFPLAMERESLMERENVMRENMALARETLIRETMAMASVASIVVPLSAMSLCTHVEAPQPIPQVQAPQTPGPQVQALQLQGPQLKVSQVQTSQAQTPQIQVPQMQVPQVQAPLKALPQPLQPQAATAPSGRYPPQMAPPDRKNAPTEDSAEVDEQWARAMAAYISTSDNEFEM
ncbi:hypothetical protein BGZ52_002234 [Haplosporangium bisporale]|nr:hypothetical protein BGZ52_002234 [Haplosporangium bisporale]